MLLQTVGAGKPHSLCKKIIPGHVVSLVAHDIDRGNVNSLVKVINLRKISAATSLSARLEKKGSFLMTLSPAIFVDRDNTLTVDDGYNFEIAKFQKFKKSGTHKIRNFRFC